MASNSESPFSFMSKRSPLVFYHDPKLPADASHPALIVILGWMAARDLHLAKYTSHYQTLYPTSRILLVKNPIDYLVSFTWHSKLAPAVDILRAEALASSSSSPSNDNEKPKLLIHIFSNGGMSTARALLDALRKGNQPPGQLQVPKHVLVMDSCPGYWSWRRAFNAVAASSPAWTHPLIHLWILANYIIFILPGVLTFFEMNPAAVRHPEFLGSQTRRLYLYGTADEMVSWRDVEDDAANAKTVGEAGEARTVVRMERFEGSKHVSHMRMDGKRYWGAITETWEQR